MSTHCTVARYANAIDRIAKLQVEHDRLREQLQDVDHTAENAALHERLKESYLRTAELQGQIDTLKLARTDKEVKGDEQLAHSERRYVQS